MYKRGGKLCLLEVNTRRKQERNFTVSLLFRSPGFLKLLRESLCFPKVMCPKSELKLRNRSL